MSRRVTVEELDRAWASGRVKSGRLNVRQCVCCFCGQPCPPQTAELLWIDGHLRGYLCEKHFAFSLDV